MKRNLYVRLSLLAVILLVCVGIFCSCGKYEKIDDMAEELVEAIIEDDVEDAIELFDFRYGEGQINSFVKQSRTAMEGESRFRIKRVEIIENNYGGGASGVAARYHVYTYGAVYELKVQRTGGIRGFASATFEKILGEGKENQAVITEIAFFWVLTAAAFGFCVWMLVDCIRRTVSRTVWGKLFWMTFIACGFVFRITFGSGGFDITAMPSLLGLGSLMTVTDKVARICVFLPVGALLYLVFRKRLSDKYVPKEEMLPMEDDEDKPEVTDAQTESERSENDEDIQGYTDGEAVAHDTDEKIKEEKEI